ncbi:ribosomal L28 family-domain-containing protein [Chaetomidium leptoderma]|uniref:Large ribosomal subunit protein bL28m n=1 Tax=Chaetomidium leptoderma TaxID=669021 RepID=A0AAN6VE33_9PEZI|nr:ribosomal L28 family-domain-containing protein [Chaetomidium leptoderma]
MPPTLPIPTCLRAAASSATRPATALPRNLLLTPTRALSTTSPTHYKQPRVPDSDLRIPSTTAPMPEMPPYPYGPRPFYHQSNTGLYGAARIRFGNNVSERNEIKTRRKWRPNVHHKRLWSASLGVFVRTRVTTRVLRTVDKAGGLDEYLLGRKPQRVKDLGPWGWRLRWRIMQSPAVRERFANERAALGLPPKEEELLKREAEEPLPDGTAAGDALMAETDQMLAEEAEFELETEAAQGAQDGFMKEEKPRQ